MKGYVDNTTVKKRANTITITLPFKDALWLMDIVHSVRMVQRNLARCPDFLHVEAAIREIQVKEIEKKAKKPSK